MVGHKQILCVLLFTVISGLVAAQNNTNSPYTRYGYGQLSDQTLGRSKGMGGVAYGLRDGMLVNAVNPASYTAIDSLTFLFDGGITLQNANLSDGKNKLNAKNSSVDYITMQFRLHKRLGITAGLLPYSNVGYSMNDLHNEDVNGYNITYSGEGGLHQAFVGLGFKIMNNFSVGANVSYLWGDISRKTKIKFKTLGDYNYEREEYMSVNDVKFDLGAQYTHIIDKKNSLTLGAVFTPKNNLNNDAYVYTGKFIVNSNDQVTESITNIKDTVTTFELPMSVGVGLAYEYDKRLVVAADYTFQKWADVQYMGSKSFYDQSKIALGIEYLPSHTSRKYLSHVKYRVGAYYSTPYYKVEDKETNTSYRAASEYGLSVGVSLPLLVTRSVLTISGQYVNVSGKKSAMLDEKYMRLSIGLTFNERWFFKRKVK